MQLFSAFLVLLLPTIIEASCEVDALFLVDSSGSVVDQFYKMREYIGNLTDLFQIGPNKHHVAILQYSSRDRISKWPRWNFDEINSNAQYLRIATQMKPLRGLTHTSEAFIEAEKMLAARKEKRESTVLFHISDGMAANFPAALEVANRIRVEQKVSIASLAIIEPVNRKQMQAFTGHPDDRWVGVPPNYLEKTYDVMRQAVVCTTTSTSTTTTTTTTTTTPLITGCELDLLFIVDKSGSVKSVHNELIEVMLQVLQDMTIGRHYTQVALIEFSSKRNAVASFHFEKHENLDDIATDARQPRVLGGLTDAGGALALAIDSYNISSYGSRPDIAKKVTVVLTDGHSQDSPADQAKALSDFGVEIYAYGNEWEDKEGFKMLPNEGQLKEIAVGDTSRVFVGKTGVTELARALKQYNTNCR